VGAGICCVGLIFAVIMNTLNKREHDRITSYLRNKAEELMNPNNRGLVERAVLKLTEKCP
jgi:hypothetical protein